MAIAIINMVIEMDKKLIGKRIRRQREHLHMTREQFAEHIEISPQFLAELENGSKGMSAETLYKMCERTEISADYILFGRTNNSVTNIHFVDALNKLNPQYSIFAEDLITAFTNAIKLAESR